MAQSHFALLTLSLSADPSLPEPLHTTALLAPTHSLQAPSSNCHLDFPEKNFLHQKMTTTRGYPDDAGFAGCPTQGIRVAPTPLVVAVGEQALSVGRGDGERW